MTPFYTPFTPGQLRGNNPGRLLVSEGQPSYSTQIATWVIRVSDRLGCCMKGVTRLAL